MESKNIELITKMVIDAINQSEDKGNGFMVPIGVSARHVHLTQEHVETLFGPGYQLTKKKDLMGGQFASNETVTIIGLKLRAIENVRVLGPVRSATQVEVSATDAIKLGMNVPVRMSGDIAGVRRLQSLDLRVPSISKRDVSWLCVTSTCLRAMQGQPVSRTAISFLSKQIMSAELSLIRLQSVWMTVSHWRCILIQMKRMQQRLPQAIQLPS